MLTASTNSPSDNAAVAVLTDLYGSAIGSLPVAVTRLPGAGSNRLYYRLSGAVSLIGVIGTDAAENRAFIYLSQHFTRLSLPVPRVICYSPDMMVYLQQDLGDTLLFDLIATDNESNGLSDSSIAMLSRTISLLPDLQCRGSQGLDYSICYPVEAFDRRSVMWDLNYFKYCFLKAVLPSIDEVRLEEDFNTLAHILLETPADSFMYRDFQSRNVIIYNDSPWFIDFQGGRRGPLHYDLASFLWQAKAKFPDSLRQELIRVYIDSLQRYRKVDDKAFVDRLRYFVVFRMLQVLGAYGFRGYFERKPHFLQSIPYTLTNLQALSDFVGKQLPYLCDLISHLSATNTQSAAMPAKDNTLTVNVISFSYKRGIPVDDSGNGGGFVFDCRAVHNPGRYDSYKHLTGRDQPVIDFLNNCPDYTDFIDHCKALVDASVDRYLSRGFTNLMVCFGCTGGRHRSVFSAECMAKHLVDKYSDKNIKIVLNHREQGITTTYTPSGQ